MCERGRGDMREGGGCGERVYERGREGEGENVCAGQKEWG